MAEEGEQYANSRLTQRAPDVWESAQFRSIFLASSFLAPKHDNVRGGHMTVYLDSATATTRARYDRLAPRYDAMQSFTERRAFER